MLSLWTRVGLVVLAMKGYSALVRDKEVEPHHQMQFSIKYFYRVIKYRKAFAQSAEAVEYTDCTSAEG